MRIYIKKLLRAPGFTLFWIVLLAISVAFSAVGFSTWLDVQNQIKQLNEKYVTAAIIPEPGEDTPRYKSGALLNAAMPSGYVLAVDDRLMLAAEVTGTTALTSGSIDKLTYNQHYNMDSYSMSVLAVECLDISEDTSMRSIFTGEYETIEGENVRYPQTIEYEEIRYTITARIVDRVSILDTYDVEIGEEIRLEAYLYQEDGTIPFEMGHTYLVFGYFSDYPIIQDVRTVTDENGQSAFEFFLTQDTIGLRSLCAVDFMSGQGFGLGISLPFKTEEMDAALHKAKAEREDGIVYEYPTEDAPPTWVEYTGDWRDFLDSEEGTYWRETLLPLCEVNQSSATIIASDNLMSMYGFNTGEYSLLSGRMFTKEEYSAGDQVCVISAAYADYNDLSLGDTIDLDLYDAPYMSIAINDTPSYFGGNVGRQTITRGRCLPENRMDVTLNCDIVGIYTGPAFSAGTHKFQADTIFIPKQAIPNAEEYGGGEVDLLQSLILKNGSKEAFEEYMAEQGFPGAYIYVDQGFEESDVSFIAMEQNANRLALISAAAFLLVTFVCEMLVFRRFRPVVRSMRLLGISTKVVLKELMLALLMLTFVAIVVGTGIGVALYGTVTGRIISENLSLNFTSVAICAGVQLVLLLIVALVRSLVSANVRLMSSMRK